MKACHYVRSNLFRRAIWGLLTVLYGLLVLAHPSFSREFSARQIGDYGNVTVMEVSGNYDSKNPDGTVNAVPRQTIAKEFFKQHKDEYDFVVVFTNFDYKMPETEVAGFYEGVKNDVKGIGSELYDNTALYGSAGRLQGTIDMGNLAGKASNPLERGFEDTLRVLVHEMQHRWGAYIRFKDVASNVSTALLGKDGAHWSYLLDTRASVMYGSQWQDNGNGTFTALGETKYYSPLDLYLMGMIDKSKIPPMLLIDNPFIDPTKMPEPGTTISGTARYITIDDIIAAEGERIPNAKDSQKQFKVAFIYGVSPNSFKGDDLYGIENIRNGLLTRFSILTDGKGLVQVASTPKENLAVNPGIRPPSSVPRTLPPIIDNGVAWLMNCQQVDGSWSDFSLTTERDTAETVTTLQHFPVAAQSFQAGFAWLGSNVSANTDFLARRIEAAVQAGTDSSSLVQELLGRRNRDGGWGTNRNFISTPPDTALALKALALSGYRNSTVTGPAIVFLQGAQNLDGGWSGDDAFSTIQPTASVLTAFNSYRKSSSLDANINKAVAFLASKQNSDGGFGNSPTTIYDSALAVIALQAAGADKIMSSRGVNYLLGQQSENGAWFESPYQTALAVRAVWVATVDPDLSIKQEDIFVIPATVTTLPTNAVLSATVWNLGRQDIAQAKVAVYDGIVAPEKKVAEQIAAFPGQSPVTLTFSIPITNGNGHYFYVVADPDNQLVESSKNNNEGVKPLLPEITYDFQVMGSDLTVAPNTVDIGKDVKITVNVSNRGTSDAYNVPLRFFIDEPGAPLEIAQINADIAAGGMVSKEVTWRASLAGVNMPLSIQVDPHNTFTETSKDNNRASAPLTVNASSLPNLSVSYKDMLINPSPAREGGSASISILVKNDGFSTAENVKVNVFKGIISNGGILLGTQLIPAIPAGQSLRTTVDWTGIAENGERIISVQLDPENAIQEFSEDDNLAFTSLRILGLSDVVVSSDAMSITPSTPKEGDQVVVTVTVRNIGDQEATNVEVLFKDGNTIIGRQTIPLLAGNSQMSLNVPYTPLGSGVHQLTAIADPDNHNIENDKQNNVATKAFTSQNARLWLSERYISPNGDGIKDITEFFFRLEIPASVTIEVSDSQGKIVKSYSGGDLTNTSGTTITWDGKDGSGSVVKDGTYVILVYGESRQILARENVVVDTNRLPLSGTLADNSLIERNISCQLPLERQANTISWLPDESGLLVHLLATVPPTPEYPAGIYLLSPSGDVAANVLSERWSDTTYNYSLKADSVAVAPDAKSLAFIAWRDERATGKGGYGIWTSDLFGGSRRLVHFEPEVTEIFDIEWSPDGKKILFNYGPFYRAGWSHFELAYVDVEQGSKKTIVYGYPLGYSGLYSTSWSPDSTRIAFIQNLFCNSELTSCNQDKERLMVYDLNGSTSTWKINNSVGYSFDSINWIDNGALFYDYESDGNIELIREGVLIPISADMSESELSPKGDKVAYVDYEMVNSQNVGRSLKIADANGSITTLHNVIKPDPSNNGVKIEINNLLWSPDGKRITFVEGLDGSLCDKPCPEAYGPNLMTVDVLTGIKESSPLSWLWAGYGTFGLNLLDWLDNGNVILAHDDTYGSGNPLLAIGRQSASSIQLVQGVSVPGEEGLLLSPNKNYLTYDNSGTARSVDGTCRSSLWSSTSVANLTADLQAIKGKQSVTFKGIATDLNFESYSIEYAAIDALLDWNPIVPLSTKPVVNGSFTDWLPPAIGTYLVRLTVRDLAGNTALKTIRVAWGATLALNSVLKSTDIISPNGDGLQDYVKLEYSVSEPVHLDFVISNESGTVVRTISVDHPEVQLSSISWDGRDEQGNDVPDGIYKIAVLDYSFSIEVDSTPPQASITMGAIKAGKEVGFEVELTGRATDKNLISWVVESGMGDNPQEWFLVAQGNTRLVKKDDLGNPVTPEEDALIDLFTDSAISSLKGKKFRITAVDQAGNRSTSISDFVEEKTLILTWDGQPKAGAILPAEAAAGTHDVTGIETLRLPVVSQRLQYWTNGVWHDAGSSQQATEGWINYSWNSTGLQMGNAYKVRMIAVDQGGRTYTSNEFFTNNVFTFAPTCSATIITRVELFEGIKSLTLAVRSDQDFRYRDWNIYHRNEFPQGETAFAGDLPTPEITAGMSYQIMMTVVDASGNLYERITSFPSSCPVRIELGISYEEAQGCGQISSGKATLVASEKDPYPQAHFLKLDYYILSSAGRELFQSVDMVREGWRQAVIDTSKMTEGVLQVQAVVSYYDRNDGKNKEASATNMIVIDRVLPTTSLTYPTGSGTTVCPVKVPISESNRFGIPLEGVADDAGKVKRYELLFGPGTSPANWEHASSAQASSEEPGGFKSVPIDGNGAKTGQFGIWDVNDLSGTNYTVRLRVVDTVGNSSCTSAGISFDKVIKVVSLSADKTIISVSGKPGADLTASYQIDENANVQLSVYRMNEKTDLPPLLDSSPIRTIGGAVLYLSGIGTASWNGLTDAGGAAPSGHYAFVVTATDACGNTGTKWAPVEVDSSPPLAIISYPATLLPLLPAMLVEVRGTVSDPNLGSYTLEAGEGDTPATWNTISTGNREVREAALGVWNTYGLIGHWTLRLTASDTVGNSIQQTTGVDLGDRMSLIKLLKLTPQLFSPNGDQRLETTSIMYEVTDAVLIKIEILDSHGAVIRNFVTTTSAGAGFINWDGRNSTGFIVADGSYTVKLTASLSSNPSITQTETVGMMVDGMPPVIEIIKPAEGFYLNTSTLSISGSVTDLNMQDYSVTLNSPIAGLMRELGDQARQNYTFFSVIDPVEETYTLTFDANDLGENHSKLVRTFTIDRTAPKVSLDAPKSGEFYGNTKNVIDLSGSIVEKNLDRYSLRYGTGETPTDWKEVVGGDTIPSTSNLFSLKVGKTDGIADGVYTISLYAKDKAGQEGEAKAKIVIDNTLPQVAITSPKDGDYVTKAIDIKGTAADTYFDTAILELAEGSCASAIKWAVTKTLNASVQDSILDSWKVLPIDGDYCIRLSATDKSGNKSETKIGIKVDTHPPAAPQLSGKTENKVDAVLTWTKNSELDLAGYNIYRNNQRANAALLTDITYLDPALKEGSYAYIIKAVDLAGNESDASTTTVKIDVTGPTVRISTPGNGTTVSNLVDIKGTAFSQDDFKEYRIFIGQGSSPSSWTQIRRSPLPISFGSLAQWDTITSQDGAEITIKLEGDDLLGNISTAQAIVTVDNMPPEAPLLLTSTPSGADVVLTWKANTEIDLAGYLLYRNDQLANVNGIVAGNLKPYLLSGTGYTDKALVDGTYRYYLVAMDQAGNSSDQSNTLDVNIDIHPPHMTILEPQNGQKFESKITIKTDTPDNDIATVQFRYKRPQDTDWINLGAPLLKPPFICYFEPKSLGLAYGEYQLQALAIDRGGKPDLAPPVVTSTYIDLTPPAPPVSLAVNVSGADVTLTWKANTESDLDGYNVYRWNNGAKTKLESSVVKTPHYLDAGVSDGNYNYEIISIDVYGNESKPSGQAARIYAPLISQPYTPVKSPSLVLEGCGVEPGSSVEITIVQDDGATSKNTVTADPAGSFKLEGITLSLGENRFTSLARDLAGNVSKNSDMAVVTYGLSPSAPTGLAASVNGYDVSLSWNNSEPDIIGYNLFRDGEKVNFAMMVTGGQASASFEDYYSRPQNAIDGNYSTYWGTPYGNGTFTPAWWQMSLPAPELINRIDIDWQLGDWDYSNHKYNTLAGRDYEVQAWSGNNWITLKKIVGNDQQSNIIDISPSYRTDRIRIAISSTTDPNYSKYVRIREIRFTRDNLIQTPDYKDLGLLDHLYSYKVTAVNQYGFESSPSTPVTAAVGDLEPPGPPINLVAVVQGSDVTLSWNPPVPASDLGEYYVYRETTSGWVYIGAAATSAPTFTEQYLVNGTYRYRVSARDLTGNESIHSNEVEVKVNIEMPKLPLMLQVSSAPTGGTLDLAWQGQAGTGQFSYTIYRSQNGTGPFTRVASALADIKYHDAGLINGTEYYYVVKALDAVGNESEPSNTASGIPQDTITIQPTILSPTIAGTTLVVKEKGVVVAGLAEPAARVEILRDGLAVGSVTASALDLQTDHPVALDVYDATLSPDGRTLAYADYYGNVQLRNQTTGETVFIPRDGFYRFSSSTPQWSPDGRFLLTGVYDYHSMNRLVLYDINNSQTLFVTNGETAAEWDGSWTQAGDAVVFVGQDNSGATGVWKARIDNIGVTLLLANVAAAYPKLSPAGDYLAYFEASNLNLFSTNDGDKKIIDDNTDGWTMAWSPDNAKLAYVSYRDGGNGEFYHLATANGASSRLTYSGLDGYFATWSPDGRTLAYATWNEDFEKLRILQSDGQERELPISQDSNGMFGMEWRRNGELLYIDNLGVHSISPSGSFSLSGVQLVAGENHLTAVSTDTSGNLSLLSEPISIVLDTGEWADLVISEKDITLFPSYPKPGENVLISARVHNPTNNPVNNIVLDLYQWDGSGNLTLLKSETIAHLDANSETNISASFNVGSSMVTHTVIAVADPSNLIQEVVEDNNYASKDILVTDQERVQLSATLNASQYASNQDLVGKVSLLNSGLSKTGFFSVTIKDAAGNVVKQLSGQSKDIPYGYNESLAFIWNTGTAYSGAYSFHTVFMDGSTIVAEDLKSFMVLPDVKISGGVTTDKSSYGPSQNIGMTVAFKNTGANYIIPELKARVRVIDQQNNELFSGEQITVNLMPNATGSLPFTWSSGLSSPGTYVAKVDMFAGELLVASGNTSFNIQASVSIGGSIKADPSVAFPGGNITVKYALNNSGNVDANGTAIISLIDPETLTVISTSQQTIAIQMGGSISGAADFTAVGLALKSYLINLSYHSQGSSASIASASVFVKDGIPPTITVESPQDGTSYTAEVALAVFVSDDASGVEKVEYSIDNGVWKFMPLVEPTKGRYSAAWSPTLVDNGSHTVSFRGTDRSGKSSQPVSVTFVVHNDTIPPILVLSTLPEGSYTNNDVLNISGTVTDNVGVKQLLINNASVPFDSDGTFSYALVLTDGKNTLEVKATDLATNPVIDTRTIYLDHKAPLIDIASPADNSKTGKADIIVTGNVDETSTVEIRLNEVTQPSQRDGFAFSATLTPSYGPNTIEVIATDPATNKGAEKRTVIFDDQKPSLAITEPGQDIRTNRNVLILKGTVADALTAVNVKIEMDDSVYAPAVNDGGYEQRLVMTEEKTYAIKVTAIDEVGNSISVQRNVIYDITPPVLTIDPVISPTNQQSQVISGTREEGSVVAVNCASAIVGLLEYPTPTSWRVELSGLGGLDDNLINVTATDDAGNISNASTNVIYDITPPTGSILINGGAGITASALVALNLTVTDTNGVSRLQLSNDGITWPDPEFFTELRGWYLLSGDGPKQVYVRYKDIAGNWSVDPIVASIVLDTTPPVVSASPAGGIYNASQTVQLIINEAATIHYTTDGSLPIVSSAIYKTPLAITADTTLNYLVIDRAGNQGKHTESYLIDTIPPVLSISTLPDGSYTNNEVLNISGTVTDSVGVKELLINGTKISFGSDGKFSHVMLMTSGKNVIDIKATDLATNPAEESRTIYLDQKAPLLVVTSPSDNSMTNKTFIDVIGYVDETSTVEVGIKGVLQPVSLNGKMFTSTVPLAPGADPNTINIKATDLALNSSSDKRSVHYDDMAPSLAIIDPGQDIRTNQSNLTIRGTASDPYGFGVVITVAMEGQKFTPSLITGKFEQVITFPTEGTYQIIATATNEAGTGTSTQRNVIYDITPPALTVNQVQSPTTTDSQTVSGTRESGLAVSVSSSTAIIGTVTYPTVTTWQVSVYSLNSGSNIITASSTDAANNVSTASKEIVYTVSTSSGMFSTAIFGNSKVTMTGGSYTDSYINAPSSWVKGKYKNGDVGTNSLQSCSIQMSGGAQVFGKAWVGHGGNPETGECMSGGSSVSGGGAALTIAKGMAPKIDPTGGTSLGAITLSGHGSKTLTNGNYRVSSITLSGGSTLTLNGPITLHIDGNLSLSGGSSIVIASGIVTIYQNGQKLNISGGTVVNNSKAPSNLTIYGTSGVQTMNLSGGSDLHALVYAPTAAIKLSGRQNTFGSIIGNTVDVSGGSSVHYDESLRN